MRKAEKYVEALIKSRQIRRRGTALILVLSLAVSGNVFWLTRAHGTDVDGMLSGGWDLSLYTCTYGGRARLTVRCDEIESI